MKQKRNIDMPPVTAGRHGEVACADMCENPGQPPDAGSPSAATAMGCMRSRGWPGFQTPK